MYPHHKEKTKIKQPEIFPKITVSLVAFHIMQIIFFLYLQNNALRYNITAEKIFSSFWVYLYETQLDWH